jgi:hypothetical protein
MFNVSLNGVSVQEPIGLDEISERIYYNEELGMYLNKLEGDLVFIGSGYEYLRLQFIESICNNIDVNITDSKCGSVYSGVIFINDIKWNLSKCTATVSIVSDKFIQLIDNNKGIKVQLGINLSKNQQAITVSPAVTISVPNPSSTVFINRIGYRVFDVFDALVRFMSNEELTFVSDYFDPINGQLPSYDVITVGEELRLGAGNITPLVSYQDFFSDMNKLHNLAGVIEGNTLRIEPKSYFRNNQISATINDINDFNQELNREQFYASVKMGSAKVADGYGYLIRLSYNGFQKEQFFLDGQCNINNELDLECRTLITDTNIIQDILPVTSGGSNNDEYDEDIVLIHCGMSNIPYLTEAPLSSNFYFNEYYTNMFVSQRWSETYPFSILQLLESENQLLFAGLTSDQTQSTTPRYAYFSPDNDNILPFFDTGLSYQIGVIQLTPTYSESVGYFEAPTDMVVQLGVDFFMRGSYWYTRVNHVDNAGNLQSAPIIIDTNPFVTISQQYYYFNIRQVQGSATFYMPAGTRLYVDVNALTDTTIFAGGQMEIFQLGSYGGVYQVINENNSFVSRTSFDIPTDSQTWEMIKSNPFFKLSGNYVGGNFTGYPIDIERNILTGNSSFNLYQRKNEVN